MRRRCWGRHGRFRSSSRYISGSSRPWCGPPERRGIPAGRTVSVAFFLLTLWPTERLLAVRRIPVSGQLVILSLLICSPFYIFWSRTFMIESTALFLSVWSLACSVWATRRPSLIRFAALCAVSSLAAAVKITTFFPFLLAMISVVSYQAWRRGGPFHGSRWGRRVLWVFLCASLPVLSLLAWTRAADHAKANSIQARQLRSSNLNTWNFGTLEQRLSGKTWARSRAGQLCHWGERFHWSSRG